jgi:hypothetical protein
VTRGALPGVSIAEIDGMLEQTVFHCYRVTQICLIDVRVRDAALISDHFAVRAEMLAVVASEATFRVEMPDVVSMRLPVGLHFGEEISLV